MPNVSIIIPVYNAQKAIERCIDSILDQEYADFELILINDGSKDGTKEILDRYAEEDDRVRVVHKENGGVSKARNTALDMATGKYLQFLDADDWIPNNSTLMMVREAEERNVDLVVSDFYRVVGENVARKGSIESHGVMSLQEYAECMMTSPSDYYYGVLWNKLYRNDIVQNHHIRMNEEIRFAEDFQFNLEYLLHVKSVYALQVPVYYYVKTEGSLVAQSLSISKVIAMKTQMFGVYDAFYRNILDPQDYAKNKLAIAGFLLAYSHDDDASVISPSTKRLGKEAVHTGFSSKFKNSVTTAYYLSKSYEKNLELIAGKYNMDIKEIKVLSALHMAGEISSIKDLADFANVSETGVYSIVTKMNIRKLVEIEFEVGNVRIRLTKEAEELSRDFDHAMDDVTDVMLKNMDDDEKQELSRLLEKVSDNLKKYLQ